MSVLANAANSQVDGHRQVPTTLILWQNPIVLDARSAGTLWESPGNRTA
jgi:hypothetical protein